MTVVMFSFLFFFFLIEVMLKIAFVELKIESCINMQ